MDEKQEVEAIKDSEEGEESWRNVLQENHLQSKGAIRNRASSVESALSTNSVITNTNEVSNRRSSTLENGDVELFSEDDEGNALTQELKTMMTNVTNLKREFAYRCKQCEEKLSDHSEALQR